MSRTIGRAAALLTALVAALFLAVGAASATTPGPQPPTLSDVHVTHGVLSGVLTVPSATSASSIDTSTLMVQYGHGTPRRANVTPIAQVKRTAVILLDTSGSMSGPKLAAAKGAARTFVNLLPPDVAVGLATFSNAPHTLVAPTRTHGAVLKALAGVKATGETSLYDAIGVAVKDLGSTGDRTIVLLSDGGDTTSKTTLGGAESALKSAGAHLTAIGFKTDDSQYGVLAKLASAGGGDMIRAGNTAALKSAFAAAAKRIAAQVRLRVSVPAGVGGHQQVTVTGTADGTPFSTTTPVALPAAAPVPPAAPVTTVAPPSSNTGLWVAAVAVFLGLLAVILLAARSAFMPAARKRIQTLDTYLGSAAGAARDSAEHARHLDVNGSLVRLGNAFAKRIKSSEETALLLERADLPLRVGEWYVLRGLAAFIGACGGWILIHQSLLAAFVGIILGLLLGLFVPPLLLKALAARRAKKFESQLPDNLTLIASSLSSGFSLPQAIDAVARDAAEPSAKEFSRALAETRIGADLEDALERLATRMDSQNLTWTVMAIRIQRNVGGNLAETLQTTAGTLRERESLYRQVRALSADGRLSSYILIALPIFIAGWMYMVNRSYLSLLWTKPLGLFMLGTGIVAMIVGIIWMRRMIRVEV